RETSLFLRLQQIYIWWNRHHRFCTSSGSLAIFAAIRRASAQGNLVTLAPYWRTPLGSTQRRAAMAEETEWTERVLIATADDVDEWSDKLLAELKRVSTNALAGEVDAFAATPSAIERAIGEHFASIDPKLRRLYFERAQSHFDKLIQQGDPCAETL